MTRKQSITKELLVEADSGWPTSRRATGQELGVLAALRNLAPRRALSVVEADLLAERQANHLLRLAQLTMPPTPSMLIAELPRILVRHDINLPVSAATQWANGRWLVLINGSEPIERQRFSLAHEYKHALDHRHRKLLYQDQPGLSAAEQAETAADAFAANLLMPAAWIQAALKAGTCSLSDLVALFQVSPRAMARRLEVLGLRAPQLAVRLEAA
jgi:hypothetical protein